MLKALWLSILGWFRTKAEANTDLRYAGKEQFARNEVSIENVRKQRKAIAIKKLWVSPCKEWMCQN
jgi:hypothetical protein